MTYSNIQLEIIKHFGSKELSEGCIITGLCLDSYWELKERRLCIKTYAWYYLVCSRKWNFHDNCWIVSKPSSIEILWHIPHFERILEVLYEKDIAVILWNMHKRTIVLEFLNEKDEECRIRELEYDWIKQPIEQDEKVLKELLEIVANET